MYRVDQSWPARLKNELLPAVSMPFRTVRISRHATNDAIGWEHLGKKLWNVSITLGEAKVKHVDENRREISKHFYRFENEFTLCNNVKC